MVGSDPMVIHYVHDMSRAISFYQSVFEINPNFESPGWTTFQFESFILALHILHGEMGEQPIPHAGLNLLVPHIETIQARIELAGGSMWELREPDEFVPVRVASCRDCEGNGFELRQEVQA